jgi:hypothetical protein
VFKVEPGTISGRLSRAASGALVALLALICLLITGAGAGQARAATAGCVADDAGRELPRVTVALLRNGIGVRRLAEVPGLALGLVSAGLGRVLPDQTYLDIGQGARAFNSLYDSSLPLVLPRGDRVPQWHEIVARAETAPGEITPGLLATTLNLKLKVRDEAAMVLEPELVVPALMGADENGRIAREQGNCEPPVLVRNARLRDLPQLIADLQGDDLLIAIERPPPAERRMLALGIAGAGYSGTLTSDTTRTPGYVLSTDLAPTILSRFGIETPAEMTGRPIRSEGRRDVAELVSLQARMAEVAPRRGPVLGVSLLIWLAVVGVAALVDVLLRVRRRDGARGPASLPRLAVALRLLALSAALLPSMLLVTAALRPELEVERLLVLGGTPLVAAALVLIAPGWRALAIAAALTVVSHAIDVITGSSLIALSLLGPNPGLGVRFYGIGNELGATLSVLLLIGIGAALAGFVPQLDRRLGAGIFIAGALPVAAVFAAGRFGADVGSAMVIPASAVVAAAVLLRQKWLALAALLVPVLGLGMLVMVDLLSGGDSHFQRTVLDSRGGDFVDTVARRLRLTGRSFVRAASGPFLPLTAIMIGLAIFYRARIWSWIRVAPAGLGAGFAGAAFAAVLGTAVNDSGILLLQVGVAYLSLVVGYAWALSGREERAEPAETGVDAGRTTVAR